MDPRRFDELTRAMAGATTRRSVLRGVAAGVAGALAGIRPGLAAKPTKPGNGPCTPRDGSCAGGETCCRGTVCAGGVCCPEALACGGVCCQAGAKCVDGACSASGGGSGAGCPAGSVRIGPNCLLVAGQPCGQGAACQTGICADGVCCDSPCTGQCEACTTGTCLPTSGPPVGSRTPCASDDSVCGGACDGANRAACAYPNATVACADPVCNDAGDAVTAACDGQGRCVERTTDCGLFVCSDGGCLDPCADNDDCLGEAYCAGGVCTADKAAGQPCAGRGECQSGFCVDGVCCTSACAPPANATATCPGGACGFACNAGYHTCDGTGCVSDASPDSCGPTGCAPCPNGPANSTRSCTNGQCGFVCNQGFKACGSTCIPLTSCCDANDCNGGSCANGLCVCGGTTCAAAKVCGPDGACTNGCFIRDTKNPNGKFWRKGDYNSDGGDPTLCRICQPQQSLNFWVNAPAGNPCGNDCSRACNADGVCSTGPATDLNPQDVTSKPEMCIFSCKMTDPQTGNTVPCCANCDTYEGDEQLGYCSRSGGGCVGPFGRFSP